MNRVPEIRFFTSAILALLHNPQARGATVYASPVLRVTATRVHRFDKRNRHTTIAVTYGELNYIGREFVKMCKRAREPFPVARPQLRLWPVPRKRAKKRK